MTLLLDQYANTLKLNPQKPLARGLVGWWPLNDEWFPRDRSLLDSPIIESGSNTNHAYVDDRSCADYGAGTGGYFDDQSGVLVPANSNFTMSGWFRLDNVTDSGRKAAVANSLDGEVAAEISWRNDGGGNNVWQSWTSSPATTQNRSRGGQPAATWLFILCRANGTTFEQWMDGGRIVDTGLDVSNRHAIGGMHIGTYRNADDRWYRNGQIADVRLWNRALSDDEIQQLYDETKDGGYGSIAEHDPFYLPTSEAPPQPGETIEEDLALSDTVTARVNHRATLSEDLALSDTITPVSQVTGEISDVLELSDTFTSRVNFNASFGDTVALNDLFAAQTGTFEIITDVLELSDTFTAAVPVHKNTISDVLELSDTLTTSVAWSATVADTIALSDTWTGSTESDALGYLTGEIFVSADLTGTLTVCATLTGAIIVNDQDYFVPNSDNTILLQGLVDIDGTAVTAATGTFSVTDCKGNEIASGTMQNKQFNDYIGQISETDAANFVPGVRYNVLITMQATGQDRQFRETRVASYNTGV